MPLILEQAAEQAVLGNQEECPVRGSPAQDRVSAPSDQKGIPRWIHSGLVHPRLEQDLQAAAPHRAKPRATDWFQAGASENKNFPKH